MSTGHFCGCGTARGRCLSGIVRIVSGEPNGDNVGKARLATLGRTLPPLSGKKMLCEIAHLGLSSVFSFGVGVV